MNNVSTMDKIKAVQSLGKSICLYKPLPAAKEYHKSQAKFRWYFGGNRSGKSEAAIGYDCCTFALGIHPYRRASSQKPIVWCCADTWDMVGKILWQEKIKKYLPKHYIDSIYWHNHNADIPRELRLTTGTTIEFKAFEQGREAFQGREIDACYCDEQCSHGSELIFHEIQARLMDRNGFYSHSMTPIRYQHWLEDRIYKMHKTDMNFHANLNDNRKSRKGFIDDTEIEAMIADWPEEVQATRIAGEFASFYGAVYKTFNRATHIIPAFTPNEDWQKWRVIDWGFNNPFVCLWMAQDNDTNWYVYNEYYQAQRSLEHHAKIINQYRPADKYICTYADHDAQDRYEFSRLGIGTSPARKDIRNGIEVVQQAMKIQSNNKPRFYVTENCINTQREIMSYRYPEGTDTKDPKDEPVKKDDHCCDAVRYVLLSVEGAPRAGIYIAKAS